AVVIANIASSPLVLGYGNWVAASIDPPTVGNILVAQMSFSAPQSFSIRSGWTTILNKSGSEGYLKYAYKIATGSDVLELQWNTAAWWNCYVKVWEFSGARVISPIGDTSSSSGSGKGSVPSVVPTTTGHLALGLLQVQDYLVSSGITWPVGNAWESGGTHSFNFSPGYYWTGTTLSRDGTTDSTGTCTLTTGSWPDDYVAASIVVEAEPSSGRRIFIT
ncbi:unnamed protein product, partial [marine sediment metagenome]